MSGAPNPRTETRSSTTRRLVTLLTLVLVSAAMVYGTWLAVDDMRAKPMLAKVAIEAGGLVFTNASDFTWSRAELTLDGRYTAAAPAPLAPGATLVLPLGSFVDADGRAPSGPAPLVREVTATATRHPRFPGVNAERRIRGRWTIE